mmetsp:Transcript_63819/g.106521  ORF Transcript_63819/g.106521 Transcript_63819/m.106521 type:complete len:241 (+) Transcript_63819:245-967(+)
MPMIAPLLRPRLFCSPSVAPSGARPRPIRPYPVFFLLRRQSISLWRHRPLHAPSDLSLEAPAVVGVRVVTGWEGLNPGAPLGCACDRSWLQEYCCPATHRRGRPVGYRGPVPLTPKVTAVTAVFPDTGVLRVLLSPNTQMMSENKVCSTPKMPDCRLNLLVLPCGRVLPRWWRLFSGLSPESQPTIGRCARAVQKGPIEEKALAVPFGVWIWMTPPPLPGIPFACTELCRPHCRCALSPY